MICQICIDDRPKVDESDLRDGFTGHEICRQIHATDLAEKEAIQEMESELIEIEAELWNKTTQLEEALRELTELENADEETPS